MRIDVTKGARHVGERQFKRAFFRKKSTWALAKGHSIPSSDQGRKRARALPSFPNSGQRFFERIEHGVVDAQIPFDPCEEPSRSVSLEWRSSVIRKPVMALRASRSRAACAASQPFKARKVVSRSTGSSEFLSTATDAPKPWMRRRPSPVRTSAAMVLVRCV